MPSAGSFNTYNETDLWESLGRGDQDAFEILYRHYFKILVNYGTRFSKDPLLLEDAIQDLFTNIWRRKAQLASVKEPKFYLLRALRNQLSQNTRNNLVDDAEDIDDFLDYLVSISNEQQTVEQETILDRTRHIQAAISRLSPRQQEAINLRFYHGMSLDQSAELMGVPKQVVSNLLFKAYSMLRLTLKGIFSLVWVLLHP
ncbi:MULTISPECIES: sigma-70 family RNA polymerase sigma factor [unclassified Spirosoma]|uniref:RNA polymerase sigma factor n=1 Tax=unclassified Spirosoma TaxID=2621999 RepID=UPI0009634207|nr:MULTISPECIES: sigma-70 family RNA polymerase sigma factor [unclassified Spirosoma]MBN8827022.1 sigma-70 family RNA polymerase sigma factor [Spirosoma sp.]OJW74431.1 MAG: RNA polymerase subunit sigma-24 [Spirosoma sp. 48-14]